MARGSLMVYFDNDIRQAVARICRRWPCRPQAGIVLGTGLGRFVETIEVEESVAFGSLPKFPQSSADGHHGRFVLGRIAGLPVIAMDGRCHVYEGYTFAQVTMPVRLMHALGIELLVVSNAAGGLNPRYRSGEVMIIDDHVNLMGRLANTASDGRARGLRRIRSASLYCGRLIERALEVARCDGFAVHRGVYAAMTGPNYETRAEYRYLRALGADAVGMSTAPEALVAAECGLRVLALSTITNICDPDRLTPAKHEDVMAAAASAEPNVRRIITGILGADIRQRTDERSIANGRDAIEFSPERPLNRSVANLKPR